MILNEFYSHLRFQILFTQFLQILNKINVNKQLIVPFKFFSSISPNLKKNVNKHLIVPRLHN